MGGGKKVKGKGRIDPFTKRAKEEGYRCRAVYKLIQLNHKYDGFLRSSHSVLDLCAAPGGWSQVVTRIAPHGCLVIALDLVRILPIRGVISAQIDITTPNCTTLIKKLLTKHNNNNQTSSSSRGFDVVLHDGSPNMGGAWSQGSTTQNALVIDSLKLATQFLAPRGTFVTKVFRSRDYTSILYCLKQLFEKVEVEKPDASRSSSAEIYLVGLKYKAPAYIDPRLLDVNSLFQDHASNALDVLKQTKHKRQRDGYDGEALVRKVCSATDFVWSDTPLEVLGSVTSISFEDPACVSIKDHNLTTPEVKTQCEDLRVLSKQDIKHLIKWRTSIRKALTPTQKCASPSTKVEPQGRKTEEGKMLNEMEELTYPMGPKKKRVKVLRAEKGNRELVDAGSDEEIGDSENDYFKEQHQEGSSDEDAEEERRKYHKHLEELLDQAYENYLEKKDEITKQRCWLKEKHSVDELYKDEDDTEHSDQDSGNDQREHEANPLMVPISTEATQEEIAIKCFSQDVFDDDACEVVNKPNYSKAKILGSAKKLFRKKIRENVLEDACMRHLFKDANGLPKCFLDEEQRHRVTLKPGTKGEINTTKEQYKDINARLGKKVAEVKGKKKRIAVKKKLEKVRKRTRGL